MRPKALRAWPVATRLSMLVKRGPMARKGSVPSGMVTSEYAVGTVAAVAVVALLIKVIDMRPVFRLLIRLWEWLFTIFGR